MLSNTEKLKTYNIKNLSFSKMIGVYVHNYSKNSMNEVGNKSIEVLTNSETVIKNMKQGDVIAFNEGDESGRLLYEIMRDMGYFTDYVIPSTLYKLNDGIVIHYFFIDDGKSKKEYNEFFSSVNNELDIYEEHNNIPVPDRRVHKQIRVMVIQKN